MHEHDFVFDLSAPRVRLRDDELLSSLEEYAEVVQYRYFPTTEFDRWQGRRCRSDTISNRFGSWKKALAIIGIDGGRERRYSPQQLVENLESIWRELGHPPGKRQMARLGQRISERPYVHRWGSVRCACELLAQFKRGEISEGKLLAGNITAHATVTIPLKTRWAVLKRDNYRCVKCGASPATNHNVELQVDHKWPRSRAGSSDLDNLQTLCQDCNQGKTDET
jgi:hypothetical protein